MTAAVCAKEILFFVFSILRFNDVSIQPLFMMSFRRDDKFVGREEILAKIDDRRRYIISESYVRLALVGLGGVGNVGRFEQGYGEIASKDRIPGWDDPNADQLRLVFEWLSDENNNHWIIILDNVDDDRIFSQASKKGKPPLETLIPQTRNGTVLVTSRYSIAAANLVEVQNILQVETMDENDSLALLKSRIAIKPPSEADARDLVKALEYLPLAITHAGAYISVQSPRITISSYLELFHRSEDNQTHLLNNVDIKDLRRDPSIRYAVIKTWQISFQQIKEVTPEAADLLAFISMFDRQSIPEDLLYSGKDLLKFEDDVAPLLDFSLVTTDMGRQAFEMHRLVQLSMLEWLKVEKQLAKWEQNSLLTLTKAFPDGEYETWILCQKLLPHARRVLTSTPIEDIKSDLAVLANHVGWYLNLDGKYEEAEAMYRRALEAREKVLGPEHPDTLTSANNLGSVLESQGKYEKAEAMYRRDLLGSEKVLGPEHPSTLISANNLGSVLESQGKYEEAEAMHRRDLLGSEKVLGPEHPSTLMSVNNLELVLRRRGKYKEAEAMHRRALEGYEKVLGPEHPHTLISKDSLRWALESQKPKERRTNFNAE
ncbi:MAG: hypothetical protein LQ340_003034 [Diploschistes diacapsis]|nr:MAG: hypothetical protein LQ340_003034 [Diploschistes diacapsis]